MTKRNQLEKKNLNPNFEKEYFDTRRRYSGNNKKKNMFIFLTKKNNKVEEYLAI